MLRRGRKGNRGRGGRRVLVRKQGKKTHPAGNPTLQFARSGAFVPKSTRTSVRFALSYAPATGATYSQVSVSGNNLFDPGLSLSSGQCVGFDYWAAMYERYRVIGSHIQVNACMIANTGAIIAAESTIAVFPATQNGSLVSISDADAQPYSTVRDVTTQTPKIIRKTMKTSTILGLKDMEGADQCQALVSAGPSNEWFWNIGIVAGAAYANVFSELDIIVTYDVEFFDRAQLNRSSLDAIHKAYLANCVAIEEKYSLLEKQREKSKSKRELELDEARQRAAESKHLDEIKKELKEIDSYQKLHKTFEPVEYKEPPITLNNAAVHEKWLKLREADELARETPKSRPPSKK